MGNLSVASKTRKMFYASRAANCYSGGPRTFPSLLSLVMKTHAARLGPVGFDLGRVRWDYVVPIFILHALALLVLLPWLFSWTGLIVFVLGVNVFRPIGRADRLSPLVNAPQLSSAEVARAVLRAAGALLWAKHAGTLGRLAPSAPPTRRSRRRSAQPFGSFLVVARRVAPIRQKRHAPGGGLLQIRPRLCSMIPSTCIWRSTARPRC